MEKINRLILCLLLVAFFVSFSKADIGPKPTVQIKVTYLGTPVQDPEFIAQMLYCINFNSTCYGERYCTIDSALHDWSQASEMAGISSSNYGLNATSFLLNDSLTDCTWVPASFAWGGLCSHSSCSFDYDPPIDFRLAVYIPSKQEMYFSNEINRTGFNSVFWMDLNSNGTGVISQLSSTAKSLAWVSHIPTRFGIFLLSAILTLLVEVTVALFYAFIRRLDLKLSLYVAVANLVSLPLFWFLVPWGAFDYNMLLFVGEVGVILVEAAIVWKLSNNYITLKHALALSLLLNVLSFAFGVLLPVNLFSIF